MTDELTGRSPTRSSGSPRRRFKRRELQPADGARLVLDIDGSILHLNDHGNPTRTWTPDDPEWPREAIRFGLLPQAPTVAPHGRHVPETKPPRW
jgi:hypothetical protein